MSIGVRESKITIAIRGLEAMFCECRVSGREIQKKFAWLVWANQTGEAHGMPSASTVARVMKAISSMTARAAAAV